MKLNVKVSPKAARNQILGWMGNVLKVSVTAPPERGQANAATCALLAEALGISKQRVKVVSGLSSPRKIVEIVGYDKEGVCQKL